MIFEPISPAKIKQKIQEQKREERIEKRYGPIVDCQPCGWKGRKSDFKEHRKHCPFWRPK